MWQRAKAACLHSVTIAWSYVLALVGAVLQVFDSSVDVLNDQGLKDAIHGMVGDAKLWGQIILGISIVNIIARLRSLRMVVPPPPAVPPVTPPPQVP